MSDHDQYEHARGNAKGWYETIRDLYREYETLDSGLEFAEKRREEIDNEVQEGPLSVLMRSGWYAPGKAFKEHQLPVEYEILLSTGGPALRIWGELTEHGEPDNARLEMQDWGVPWREVWPYEGGVLEADECCAALLWYAGHFYFGE